MSEPVGNQPRKRTEAGGGMSGITGNSHKNREAAAESTAEREPVQKIVTGTVISRKQSRWKKFARSMIAEDVNNVGDLILSDVVIPAIKTLIVNMVGQGTERLLFGTSGGRVARRPIGLSLRDQVRYDQVRSGDREPRRLMSREARARHDFNEIVLDNRTEAIEVVEDLVARILKYGAVTVSELYDLVGTTGSYMDRAWGWTDLSTADVKQVAGGFLLDLPAPEPIR